MPGAPWGGNAPGGGGGTSIFVCDEEWEKLWIDVFAEPVLALACIPDPAIGINGSFLM